MARIKMVKEKIKTKISSLEYLNDKENPIPLFQCSPSIKLGPSHLEMVYTLISITQAVKPPKTV